MKRKVLFIVLPLTLVVVGVLGYTVPLGSYVSLGCPTDPLPEKHLHLIFGESIKASDNNVHALPNVGCSLSAKYTQYIL